MNYEIEKLRLRKLTLARSLELLEDKAGAEDLREKLLKRLHEVLEDLEVAQILNDCGEEEI